jgi:hypothetical protein
MEPFRGIRPIAPFNDAVLPRRSGFDPPMPQPHVGDRSFEGRASLWMRGIRHRKDHGIIRDRQMKRGQASNRPAQHPGNPAAGARRVDFRVLHSGSQMNQTDRVLPSAAPANRQQLLNIQLDPMASDRNRAALPFFLADVGSTRRHAGCARPSRCWRWEHAAADPAHGVWGRAGDAPAVPRSRRHERRRSRLAAHGCAARRCDQRCPDGRSSAGSCGDARQIDGPTRIDSSRHDAGVGRGHIARWSRPPSGDHASITCTVLSKHPPEVH